MSAPEPLPLSKPIREAIVATIRQRFSATDRDERPLIDAMPSAIPEGEVVSLARGGPFGWMLDARLDRIEGRTALEVLENDRMSGEDHYRLWDDGKRENLVGPHIAYSYGPDATPEEKADAEQRYFEHNRAAYDHLRKRGFYGPPGEV